MENKNRVCEEANVKRYMKFYSNENVSRAPAFKYYISNIDNYIKYITKKKINKIILKYYE